MDCKTKDLLFLVSLQRISFLNLAEKINLFKKLDSSDDLALLSLKDISALCGRTLRAAWNGSQNLLEAERETAILQKKKIGWLLHSDADYPALLRETPNAPFVLFYRGNASCLQGRTVSVVGTRGITPQARRECHAFALAAVCAGYTVVSGLAQGVDGAAHAGAVDAFFDAEEAGRELPEGRTVAVLPCGCDTVTPYGHRRLAEHILETGGALVSEYVPGVPAEPWRFVQRNRIIAALSPATVVIQAPAGSGALLTAQFALDYDRDVLFHKAALSEEAQRVSSVVSSELEERLKTGAVSRAKCDNTVRKYLELGAPVIENFNDYCACMRECPGVRASS